MPISKDPERFRDLIQMYTHNKKITTRLFHIFEKHGVHNFYEFQKTPILTILRMKGLGPKMKKHVSDMFQDVVLAKIKIKFKANCSLDGAQYIEKLL